VASKRPSLRGPAADDARGGWAPQVVIAPKG
jgi:hypothetical protein